MRLGENTSALRRNPARGDCGRCVAAARWSRASACLRWLDSTGCKRQSAPGACTDVGGRQQLSSLAVSSAAGSAFSGWLTADVGCGGCVAHGIVQRGLPLGSVEGGGASGHIYGRLTDAESAGAARERSVSDLDDSD